MLALYKRMTTLRKGHQALRYGGCRVIYAEDNVVVFVRVYKQQRVLVAINRGHACEVVIDASPLLEGKKRGSEKKARARCTMMC